MDTPLILGIVGAGLLLIGWLLWLGRETPAQRAQRARWATDVRWYRQHRAALRAERAEREAAREARVREIAEGVRRGQGGW